VQGLEVPGIHGQDAQVTPPCLRQAPGAMQADRLPQ